MPKGRPKGSKTKKVYGVIPVSGSASNSTTISTVANYSFYNRDDRTEEEIKRDFIQEFKSQKKKPVRHTEDSVLQFLAGMYAWACRPDTLYITHYWSDPSTDHSISRNVLKDQLYRYPHLKERYDAIGELMATKLIHAGATGKLYFGAVKFALMNKYGWTDKSEQDLTVTNKNVEFTFDNPETTDTEYKEINDDDNEDIKDE